MEFKFKRKYTNFFIFALILHLAVLSFWLFFPNNAFANIIEKQTLSLIALINCELILLFYLGLFRKKYFAYYDKLIIKRSFFKTLIINYKDIHKIKEENNDTIFLTFGHRPSFTLFYKNQKGKNKKIIVRSDNNPLLLKVIKNEIDISNLNNINIKKLTK